MLKGISLKKSNEKHIKALHMKLKIHEILLVLCWESSVPPPLFGGAKKREFSLKNFVFVFPKLEKNNIFCRFFNRASHKHTQAFHTNTNKDGKFQERRTEHKKIVVFGAAAAFIIDLRSTFISSDCLTPPANPQLAPHHPISMFISVLLHMYLWWNFLFY